MCVGPQTDRLTDHLLCNRTTLARSSQLQSLLQHNSSRRLQQAASHSRSSSRICRTWKILRLQSQLQRGRKMTATVRRQRAACLRELCWWVNVLLAAAAIANSTHTSRCVRIVVLRVTAFSNTIVQETVAMHNRSPNIHPMSIHACMHVFALLWSPAIHPQIKGLCIKLKGAF